MSTFSSAGIADCERLSQADSTGQIREIEWDQMEEWHRPKMTG
jgi:hypothetical protein